MRTFVKTFAFATLAILASASAPAKADLVGTTVTGTLKFGANPLNFFDPANGFVPAAFKNSAGPTVVIAAAPPPEFGFADGANQDVADFTGSTLSISDVSASGAGPFVMTFTNNAFTGLTLAKVNDTFAGGITGSLAGNLITITYGGTNAAGTYNAEFTLLGNSAAVPEPSQFALAGVAGLFAAGSWFRRRRRTA